MKKDIFRKESLDQMVSPDQLGDYIRVSNPGSWMLLTAALFFVIGFCVWGIFGRITDQVQVAVISDEDGVRCLIREETWQTLDKPVTVCIGGEEYAAESAETEFVLVDKMMKEYTKSVGGFLDGERIAEVPVEAELPRGIYRGEILTESLSPMSYIWN